MAKFDDGKDSTAFRTIGEVSDALGIKPHVLRYWEQQFSLLDPLKRSGGRRLYRPKDIQIVERIDQLVNEEGYTLKGAEAVLRSNGSGEFDRRKSERRSGDRRLDESEQDDTTADLPAALLNDGQSESELAIRNEETVAKLKSLRKRLAKAIED